MRQAHRARRGNQAIEFALVLPVLAMVVAGIIDYGWYASLKMAMVDATREAVRAASVSDDDLAAEGEGEAAGAAAWTAAGLPGAPVFDLTPGGLCPDAIWTAVGTMDFTPFFGFPGVPVPGTVTHTVIMRACNGGCGC